MKRKRRIKLLPLLAAVSFIITAVQGILFYEEYKPFFRSLLVLQNSINAFGFKPSVTIKDVISYIGASSDVIKKGIGYLYCIAVFTAPYCTISFLYKFLEKILRMIIGFRRRKNCVHTVIFGYNDDVRAMLTNSTVKSDRHSRIHIVTAQELSSEEFYKLNKLGYAVHCADVLKASEEELKDILHRTCTDIATNIVLFEESSVRNFSLLQMFRLNGKDDEYRLIPAKGTKISCRCEEEGIGRLIAEYYDTTAGTEACFDLEVVGLPEMQIRKLFSDHPLHSVYAGTDKPLCEWNVHMLVTGFGRLGQEAVIQAINLSVVHENNDIIIDVVDSDIRHKMKMFANQFSSETFDITEDSIIMRPSRADGILEIRFHPMNVLYQDFYELVRREMSALPYTYAVIALEDIDVAVGCAMELNEIFGSCGSNIPIAMRMDSDRRLAGYITSSDGVMSDVCLIDDRDCILTLDMIIGREIDKRGKVYNHFYNSISIIGRDDAESTDSSAGDPEAEWNRIRLFRRASSKAAAYHDDVKDVIIPKLAEECGVELDKKLEELLGREGSLMQYTGRAWRMRDTDEEFVKKLKKDSFSYNIAALEHRRWCCYMASNGWKCGKRSDRFRSNPCLVGQAELMEIMPEMCKYDLMSLMARYKKRHQA